jgi:hypothetical protein
LNNIKIISVVEFNDHEAYVINRKPKYIYQKENIKGELLLHAVDGGFVHCYKYEKPMGSSIAFAGRKFNLPLIDGGVEKCYGQWWDGGQSTLMDAMGTKMCPVTLGTIEELKRCYVYYGSWMEKEALIKMRDEYTGQVYKYWEYEKIIKYDDMRKDSWGRESKLRRDKKNLIKEVKIKHEKIKELQLVVNI